MQHKKNNNKHIFCPYISIGRKSLYFSPPPYHKYIHLSTNFLIRMGSLWNLTHFQPWMVVNQEFEGGNGLPCESQWCVWQLSSDSEKLHRYLSMFGFTITCTCDHMILNNNKIIVVTLNIDEIEHIGQIVQLRLWSRRAQYKKSLNNLS